MNTSDIIAGIALIVSLGTLVFSIISERTKRKPILVFEYQTASGWHLNNIGNGPALNVVMGLSEQRIEKWEDFVRIPALAVGSKFHIFWLGDEDIRSLGAEYMDFADTYYSTISIHDKNYIKRGPQIVPKGAKIERYWNKVRPI